MTNSREHEHSRLTNIVMLRLVLVSFFFISSGWKWRKEREGEEKETKRKHVKSLARDQFISKKRNHSENAKKKQQTIMIYSRRRNGHRSEERRTPRDTAQPNGHDHLQNSTHHLKSLKMHAICCRSRFWFLCLSHLAIAVCWSRALDFPRNSIFAFFFGDNNLHFVWSHMTAMLPGMGVVVLAAMLIEMVVVDLQSRQKK